MLILRWWCRQRCVPILPDRFVAQSADALGDLLRRTFVGNVELAGGVDVARPFACAEFHDSSTHGLMQVFFARAGVAARFSVAAGAHQRDAERNEAVA